MKFKIASMLFFVLSSLAYGQEKINLIYTGDLFDFLPKLNEIDPDMKIMQHGARQNVPLSIFMSNVSKLDIFKEVGGQSGQKADLIYLPMANSLSVKYKNIPAPAPAPSPVPVKRNPDGSIVVLFGEARPKLVCQTLDVCAIKLESGERINRLDVGDKERWEVSPSLVGEDENRSIVLIVRPTLQKLKTKMIVTTNRRIYSIDLSSPAFVTDDADTSLSFIYSKT